MFERPAWTDTRTWPSADPIGRGLKTFTALRTDSMAPSTDDDHCYRAIQQMGRAEGPEGTREWSGRSATAGWEWWLERYRSIIDRERRRRHRATSWITTVHRERLVIDVEVVFRHSEHRGQGRRLLIGAVRTVQKPSQACSVRPASAGSGSGSTASDHPCPSCDDSMSRVVAVQREDTMIVEDACTELARLHRVPHSLSVDNRGRLLDALREGPGRRGVRHARNRTLSRLVYAPHAA